MRGHDIFYVDQINIINKSVCFCIIYIFRILHRMHFFVYFFFPTHQI